MSTSGTVGRVGLARSVAWQAGGFLLLALGIGILAIALGGLLIGGGGVGLLPLAVPPIAAGYGVIRRMKWARFLGIGVGLAYAIAVAYVATTPWRGLTPAPGEISPAMDLSSILVAIASLAAAILLALGKVEVEGLDDRHGLDRR